MRIEHWVLVRFAIYDDSGLRTSRTDSAASYLNFQILHFARARSSFARIITVDGVTKAIHIFVLILISSMFLVRKNRVVSAAAPYVVSAMACHDVALCFALGRGGACSFAFVSPVASVVSHIFLFMGVYAAEHASSVVDAGGPLGRRAQSLVVQVLQFAAALHILIFPAGEYACVATALLAVDSPIAARITLSSSPRLRYFAPTHPPLP